MTSWDRRRSSALGRSVHRFGGRGYGQAHHVAKSARFSEDEVWAAALARLRHAAGRTRLRGGRMVSHVHLIGLLIL
jgi:hypothetical protein